MLIMKIFPYLFLFTLIFVHSISHAQEKMKTAITQEEPTRTFLIFSTKGLDKEVIDVLTSEKLPQKSFAIGTKGGETLAVFTKGVPTKPDEIEYTSIKLTGAKAVESIKSISLEIKDLIKAFEDLRVDQIEIWINAGAETGGVTRLIVSAKGEGGIKVILKPKK